MCVYLALHIIYYIMRRQRVKEDSSRGLLRVDWVFPHRNQRRRTKFLYAVLGVVVVSVAVCAIVVVVGVRTGLPHWFDSLPTHPYERALAILSDCPVIDGHNDLPWQIRVYFGNQLDRFNLSENTTAVDRRVYGDAWQTDIPRLRAGKVGAQFWSSWMTCDSKGRDAVKEFIEQIDIIMQVIDDYPETFRFATSASEIETAAITGHIASLIGVEGGYAIDNSLGVLRQLYRLGARYMTLTHNCDLQWAHTHNSTSRGPRGLSEFGKRVVWEMNRLGMMVDLSHVSSETMMDALDVTLAPVIFSHSSAFAVCNFTRNVPDYVLRRVPRNHGIVMVNFFTYFVSCGPTASLQQVADHIDHIRDIAGMDHIGVGSDFDGIEQLPVGLEDVSKFPALFAELIRRGYSDEDVRKIARLNLIRTFREVEKVRDSLKGQKADNSLI